ncbi:hypothetical protein B7463_g5718, partial [Scytalidium lignicola]
MRSLTRKQIRLSSNKSDFDSEHKQRHLSNTNAIGLGILGLAGLGYAWGVYTRNRAISQAPQSAAITKANEYLDVYHDLSDENVEAAYKEFVSLLGPEHVSLNPHDLLTHSGSEFQSYKWIAETAETCHIVLYPHSTDEVSEITKICHRRRLPITPYSGGTSIEGQYITTGGVCIDFGKMDRILEVNVQDLDCTVQPGVRWQDLNEEVEKDGLFFPPDPGPGAMIGGMVGTGCSGTNAAAYGTMKDWVVSLTVVLSDGTIIKTRQRPRKSSAGYDLTRMFVGSEGTLGLVTEATLKLAVKPTIETVAIATFPDIYTAARAVQTIMSRGIRVAAVELLDDIQMSLINKAHITTRVWEESPTLFFKVSGSTSTIVDETTSIVKEITKRHGCKSFEHARSQAEREDLWSARKVAFWSMMALRESDTDKIWTTDVAVPLSKLADIIQETKDRIKASGLTGSILGHVGDGNYHTLILFDENKRQVAEELVHWMVERAIEMKGTSTGEHGIGLVKRDYLELELGKSTVDTMRRMKIAFDPLCLLNCNKVIRVQKES